MSSLEPGTGRQQKLGARPLSPVPWVIVGVSAVWAWQPDVGLVKLQDAILSRPEAEMWSLSVDGTTLRWRIPVSARLRAMCHLSLQSGAVMLTEAAEPVGQDFYGPDGAVCEVRFSDLSPSGIWQRTDYSVRHNGKWHRLALRDRLRTQPSSPGVQFSPNGDRVAITTLLSDEFMTAVEVIDVHDGTVEQFTRTALQGSGAWSPDGRNLLVEEYDERSGGYHTAVLDVVSGSTSRVFTSPEQTVQAQELTLVGWITDRRLLGYQLRRRTLLLWVLDVENGSVAKVAEMRSPVGVEDLNCLLIAPLVVQATPHTLDGH